MRSKSRVAPRARTRAAARVSHAQCGAALALGSASHQVQRSGTAAHSIRRASCAAGLIDGRGSRYKTADAEHGRVKHSRSTLCNVEEERASASAGLRMGRRDVRILIRSLGSSGSRAKVPRRGSAIRKRHLRMLKCGVRVGVTVLTSVPELPSAHEALRGGNRRAIRTRSRSHSQWDCYHSTDSAKLTRNRGCGLAVLTVADQRRQRRVRHSPIRKSGAFRTGTLRASRSTQPLHSAEQQSL
jgi:hypothetical protein